MKTLITAVAPAILLLGGCGNDASQPIDRTVTLGVENSTAASVALENLVEAFFERVLKHDPLRATFIGDYRYDDRLAIRISPEFLAERRALNREYLDRLSGVDAAALSGQDRLTYDIFKLDRELALASDKFPSYLLPINHHRSFVH